MNHPGRVTTLGGDCLNASLFTEGLAFADEFDLESSLVGQSLGVGADLFSQRLSPLGIVEQANVARPKLTSHGVGMADVGKGAGDHDAVETEQHTADLVSMLFGKGVHFFAPGLSCLPSNDSRSALFGSGFTGLGEDETTIW